jgi:hypothetical protein
MMFPFCMHECCLRNSNLIAKLMKSFRELFVIPMGEHQLRLETLTGLRNKFEDLWGWPSPVYVFG